MPQRNEPARAHEPPRCRDPWCQLERRSHIVFARRPLPAGLLGVYGLRGERAAIVLDTRLDERDERCVLMHELVHDDRQDTLPHRDASDEEIGAEEQLVDAEAARHLVPADRLAELLDAVRALPWSTDDLVPVVCAAFDVNERCARIALADRLEALR